MRSDVPVLNLAGEDLSPDRSNVFFLYDFPKEWKHHQILEVFKDLGTVVIKWVREMEVRVVVEQKYVQDILDAMEVNEARHDKQYRICTDEQYRAKRGANGMSYHRMRHTMMMLIYSSIGSLDFVSRDLKRRHISSPVVQH
jgi:hypothetical protein